MKKTARKKNYVNNADLLAAVVEHRTAVAEAVRLGRPKPQLSRYIGESILMMCDRLGRRPNFSGYSFIDEMKSDAVLDCVSAVEGFDHERFSNVFGYLTQCAWNAFIRRIQKEKKQSYIKHRNFENVIMSSYVGSGEHDSMKKHMEYSQNMVRTFDAKAAAAKTKRRDVGVEKFQVDRGAEVV